MVEIWTRSAISERLYLEMCQYDDDQEPLNGERKYHVRAIKYANRRAIVKGVQDFKDVFLLFLENFSSELKQQILNLRSDKDAMHEVISDPVKRMIKSRAARIYYEYLQHESLRWCLIDGDGNGKGDCSVIEEHVSIADTESEEDLTLLQRLAKRIVREHIFKTTTDNAEIYWYDRDRGIYVPGQEWRIKERCRQIVKTITTHQIQEVINYIKDTTYVDRSEFDKNPDIINFKNGLLNIHTLKLGEHSPDELYLNQIDIVYDAKARCPTIIKFLHEVLRSTNDYITAIELFGYCLYKTAKYEKALLCVGPGDNAKGTFLKLFDHLVGPQNASHVSLQDMNMDRFAIAHLYGKSVNTFADLPYTKLSATGNFKMLASGDSIRAQKKGKDGFYFNNHALLVFSANLIPQSDDETYAYYKRWIIFLFEHKFTGPDRDNNLIQKMTRPSELSGLFNLALIGLRKLIKDNAFLHVDDIEKVQENYLKGNPVKQFLKERCIVNLEDESCYTICRDLFHEYILYCKDAKLTAVSDNIFGMEMHGEKIKRERLRINKAEREYCYIGVKLKPKS